MTEGKMKRAAVCLMLSLALIPGVAFASTSTTNPTSNESLAMSPWVMDLGMLSLESPESISENNLSKTEERSERMNEAYGQLEKAMDAKVAQANKILPYDPALINQIGTQEKSGHTICCPSFSCAYADAVMDGTVRDHSYYTCRSCSWRDWGGGNSSFRNLGSSQALLREAYDQISIGRPTVIHVAASYGEHWIALIGYENALNPDNLSLSNFIALDPWDGSQVNAGASFRLYGDNCEHISQR